MSNSIVNLGDLTKPIDSLINKISDATGVLYEPRRIRQKANAESDAAIISAKAEVAVEIIKAESQIEITDLHKRAEQRLCQEEAKRQKNMEDVIAQAVSELNEEAKPHEMENDWISNFFDKCRIVSDTEMQSLWSRVLAGEANAPGTYSKRTVNFISELDKSEAELFTKLCGFCWVISNYVPLVLDHEAQIYYKSGIHFNSLSHLESIGLVQFGMGGEFTRVNLPRNLSVYYYGEPLSLEFPKESGNELKVGETCLTQIGHELAPICGSKPVAGFYEYVKGQWSQYLPTAENMN